MDIHQLIADAIPIIAEDLKDARMSLGITPAKAARKVGINTVRYRRLESGKVARNKENVARMISVARSLGMDSVRVTYVDELQKYMKIDISDKQYFSIFIDSLSSNISELKDMGHFVSPYNIFALVDEIGLDSILECKNSIDKEIFELWVTALFSLGMDSHNQAHYVRPVRDNVPDTEILTAKYESGDIQETKIEITQYRKHSENIYEIIKKKLMKRYDEDTVVVVLADKKEEIYVADLYEFIHKNNSDNRRLYIIGGVGDENRMKIVPCGEIKSTLDEKEWVEINIDVGNRKKVRNRYDGVIFKVPFMKRFHRVVPVFVREISLSR